MGRQKIEIKKIENEEALQVCFSKRRAGLFKKASELSTLCGAEVAIVVFSPAGRPYSIGLPDMDTVVNRFLLCNPAPTGDNAVVRPTRQRNVITRQLNKQMMELRSLLEQQRGRRMPMEMMARNSARSIGVDSGPNFEGLSLDRLMRLEEEMLQLRCRVAVRVDELMHGVDQSPPLPPPARLALLPEAGVPMNYMNQVGFVDPPTQFHEPDVGFLGASSGMGGGAGVAGPSDAAFGYSDPFPNMLVEGNAAAHGVLRDGFPDGFY